jgi:NAD(P)H-dependent flavin oxidoreductase YrpB (nitropropane dioxygenase family)
MNERGTRRLSLAISEGDGISVLVEVATPEAAGAAEEQGADGVVVGNPGAFRDATELPILWPGSPDAADAARADACLLVANSYGEDWQRLADDLARGLELGLDSVVEVHDEEELQATLEHVDPEIVLLAGEPHDPDAAGIDHVLELLPDVPAGKLAVADLPDATHDEVEALERAGVDAVVVNASDVRELVGAEPPSV